LLGDQHDKHPKINIVQDSKLLWPGNISGMRQGGRAFMLLKAAAVVVVMALFWLQPIKRQLIFL
jgi:hypothetical protein